MAFTQINVNSTIFLNPMRPEKNATLYILLHTIYLNRARLY